MTNENKQNLEEIAQNQNELTIQNISWKNPIGKIVSYLSAIVQTIENNQYEALSKINCNNIPTGIWPGKYGWNSSTYKSNPTGYMPKGYSK